MNELVIFGTGQIAELAHFYFSHDSSCRVAAFTVDGEFLEESTFCGLPVVPFESVQTDFPAERYRMFIAASYSGLNRLRHDKFLAARQGGYALASYLSSRATTWPGFEVKDNCFILEDNTIQPFAQVGENVTLWSGNHIGHHSSIGSHTFVASHVVVSGNVRIGERCFLGVNATLRDGIQIGDGSLIGAGALVLKDIPPDTLVPGAGTEFSKVPASRTKF